MNVSRETALVGVSRETWARLDIFEAALLRWNARINLMSRGDETALRARHIDDALQLVELVPPGTQRGLDLGSGAGFPGLVLALVTDTPFDLVESDRRKCAFLREAARATQAPVKVHAVRIESLNIAPAKLITARALARLKTLLDLAVPLLAEGGVCLFPKGESAEQEIEEASAAWTMRIERIISRTDRGGVILRISEVTRV